MAQKHPDSGWDLITHHDEAAALISALLELESGQQYSRSELADAADIPMKTLYLDDTLEKLVAVGMLERVDDGSDASEAQYVLDADGEVLAAARTFDDAVSERLKNLESD